jgi:hypothetical protein
MRRIGEIIDELDLKGKNEELVKELVALSTKHGILTPYTSFLADEKHELGGVRLVSEFILRCSNRQLGPIPAIRTTPAPAGDNAPLIEGGG